MAGGKLTVQIGADITDFERKLKEVEFDIKELSKVKLDRLKLGLDTTEINRNIKSAKDSLSTLKATAESTGNAFSKSLSPKVANGSNALMQFSRIAQDAPYGIIGIGNNITATAESFSYLKAQTGSTGGALKALASSLMGTGGILLGVSLLTTGLTLLSQSGLSVGDVIDKITGKFDEFGGAIKKASEEAVANTAGEIFGLKSLIAVAQDETKAKKERLAAVESLQKTYPGYFGNLSKEQIMTSDLTSTVNELTQALINKEAASLLAKAAAPQLLALYKLNATYKKQRAELTESEIALKRIGEEQGKNTDTYKEASATVDGLYNILEKTRGEIYKSTQANKRYEDSINAINSSTSKLLIQTPKAVSALKAPKTPKVNPNEGNVFRPFLEGNISSSLVPELALTFTDPTEGFTEWNSKVQAGLTTAEQALLDFNYAAAELINNSVANTFSDLGTVIGEALATGGNVLSAIGTTLLQSLGKFLSDMGGMLIQYGTLAVVKGKLDLAIAAGGPISIGAGLAAIAVGVALKAIGGAIGAKAKSGGGSTSTSTGSDANNRSFSSGSFSSSTSSSGGTVVFEIAGQKLIGVLSNTLNANKRLGGQTTLAI